MGHGHNVSLLQAVTRTPAGVAAAAAVLRSREHGATAATAHTAGARDGEDGPRSNASGSGRDAAAAEGLRVCK